MRFRSSGWLGVLLVCAGCAAAGHGDRPPAPGPAPSPGAITSLGYEGAVKAGSDYVAASTNVPNPTLARRQLLPSGMLQLDFDLGPSVPEPVRVTVDPDKGKVHSLEPVQQIPGILTPAKPR
ncbi:MAG: hypothetical protein EHM78_07660 [Myxococcaceae bacterium]|nr:MAG: hypothetical protein EHM78_07660 [Myxococcaceae bacterium]